jgi:hypothetical protein
MLNRAAVKVWREVDQKFSVDGDGRSFPQAPATLFLRPQAVAAIAECPRISLSSSRSQEQDFQHITCKLMPHLKVSVASGHEFQIFAFCRSYKDAC